jgi:hypothetical protein
MSGSMPGPGHCGDPPLSVVGSLVPAAVLAPVAAAVADRRSPVVLLAGGYLVQAAANVVMGWLEAAGIMTAGLLVGGADLAWWCGERVRGVRLPWRGCRVAGRHDPGNRSGRCGRRVLRRCWLTSARACG